MGTDKTARDLARWAADLGAQWARRVQEGQSSNGWENRTVARHTDRDGKDWAVIVDWATDRKGNAVPASVTLTSVGGTLGEPRPEWANPASVTRAVVESVPWGTAIWGSREAAKRIGQRQGQPAKRYTAPDGPAAEQHDRLLRHVADIYRSVKGSRNPFAARDVWTVLGTEGVTSRGGGALTRTRVRTWLQQARERGYISPDD
ncbi:hypothetical protein KVF89_16310 [Nocardioides carbamazepini]|uniref:hypothetical protein n=1 Tax=Nocardioides carbamazepini TaxID=2854259 RepID=UPI002149EB2E|nr:hypothetical protein [Nocardioides carbamazepini]MCR1784104.1 hypothetical protein [Nocardioides carbamazepini]